MTCTMPRTTGGIRIPATAAAVSTATDARVVGDSERLIGGGGFGTPRQAGAEGERGGGGTERGGGGGTERGGGGGGTERERRRARRCVRRHRTVVAAVAGRPRADRAATHEHRRGATPPRMTAAGPSQAALRVPPLGIPTKPPPPPQVPGSRWAARPAVRPSVRR